MGCTFSRVKPKPTAPPPQVSVKTDKTSAHSEAAPQRVSTEENPCADPSESPACRSPHSPIQLPYTNGLAATDEDALDNGISKNILSNGPCKVKPPTEVEKADDGNGDSGMDLNGSFANIDLSGSFHIHYNTKGDIIPNATLPESRRGRSVSPKLLATLSPHPSDDELVLVCTDCGMTIDENCEPMCSLTGKLHI